MREGWEYKKLGDVCDKGSSNIVINKLGDNNGEYPLYGASGLVKSVNFYHQDKPYIGIVKDGAGVGRVNIYPAFSSLVGTMQYIFTKDDCLLNYLKYFLIKLDLSHCVSGATIPHIYFKDYSKKRIPVPSLETQQSIVSELDKINELISLKKSQLEDLDSLAQSIFYDMFGDPVENEKGWEVKKLGEICDVRDGTHDSPSYYEKGYPLITSKNVIDGIISFENVNYINKEDFDKISRRSKVDNGDIIMPMIGTIGRPIIVKKNREFAIKNVALIKFLHESKVLNTYIQAVMSSSSFDFHMKRKNKGGTQKFIALGEIRKLKIPLPPLSLQQTFAKRIEVIEQQKQQINKTIKDLETLLASRMQYWFD